MSDVEKLLWTEKRYGLTKKIKGNPSNDKIYAAEAELMSMLHHYHQELNIPIPIPKLRMWFSNNRLNFHFTNKRNDKRILLGDWLLGREITFDFGPKSNE